MVGARYVSMQSKKRRDDVRPCFLNVRLLLLICALLLLSCGNGGGSKEAARLDVACPAYAADGLEVTCLTFRQTTYVVLGVDLRAALVRTLWKNPAGLPYGSLGEAYRQAGGGLLALTNAGIYSESRTPEGLHVERGATWSPLNLNAGEGNFYLRPNGVFYVAGDGAGIVESEKFDSLHERDGIDEATQSGPLLVIDGEVNRAFHPDSRSLYVRNGIGVKSPEEVYIVISGGEVSLYDFASVFREQLHCRNALYLDGCVSQVYLPASDVYVPARRRCDKELVGLLGVVKRK